MCRKKIQVEDPITGQWLTHCPKHPLEILREGIGCRICGFGGSKDPPRVPLQQTAVVDLFQPTAWQPSDSSWVPHA